MLKSQFIYRIQLELLNKLYESILNREEKLEKIVENTPYPQSGDTSRIDGRKEELELVQEIRENTSASIALFNRTYEHFKVRV